jgi:Tfp pilus assembly protein PilN
MALHINLYHEIHKQADQERRDPVKLASLGLVVIFLCLALWYFYQASAVRRVEARRADLKAQWTKLEPQLKAAQDNEPKLLTQQKSNQELVERLHQRFYWAPLLAKLQALVPANVQIVSLIGDIEPPVDGQKTPMSLLVKGVAASAQPRASAEAFRQALQTGFSQLYSEVSVVFDANTLEDGLEMVQFNGQLLPTANFRIRVLFKQPAALPEAPKTK